MAKATGLDVNIFTLDAAGYLGDAFDGTIEIDQETTDTRTLAERNQIDCVVKRSATLDVNLSSSDGNCKVTGLNTSAFSIGGVNLLDYLETTSFNIANEFKRTEGVADLWAERTFTGQNLTGTATVMVDTDASAYDDLMLALGSSDPADTNVVYAFTLNGVAVSVPMVLKNGRHKMSRNDIQTWEFQLGSRGAATSPSGTSSLLEKALVTPETAQALILYSRFDKGLQYAGDFVAESLGITINRQDAVMTNLKYVNQGALSITATAD